MNGAANTSFIQDYHTFAETFFHHFSSEPQLMLSNLTKKTKTPNPKPTL